jgi:hypothetical protein
MVCCLSNGQVLSTPRPGGGILIHLILSLIICMPVFFSSSDWSLSEDHILYMLGHQSLLLKEHSVAADLFNDLLAMTSPGLNPLQQVSKC